jgi:hypothetical protein
MDINTIIGLILAVAGSGTGIWAYLKNKVPKEAGLIDTIQKTIEQLSKNGAIIPVPSPVPTPAPVPVDPPFDDTDRVLALHNAELVLRYLEKKGSKAGSDALTIVVTEILNSSAPKA